MKQKKCKYKSCGISFTPSRPLQSVCSPICGLKLAEYNRKKNAEKKLRRELREGREKLKTAADHAKEAQMIINRYVRLRDRNDGCISCDKPSTWHGQWHASHLRSVGSSPSLRFNLWNIHKSCSVCNNHLSGNISEYLTRVREKIGDEKVDWLYSQNKPAKFDIDYLKRLKKVFRKKIRMIERRL